MPRNFSELKSGGGGGTIPMLSPTLKSPPPIDARGCAAAYQVAVSEL